jgi:phosphoglycerol transferase MdoB-like AlkP superfamily enzyme
MDLVLLLYGVFFWVMVVAIQLVERRCPSGWRERSLPYLFIFPAVVFSYLGHTAHQRESWWFVPPLSFLILGILAFVRQRKIEKTGHPILLPQH